MPRVAVLSCALVLAVAAAGCSRITEPPAPTTIPITTTSEQARANYLEGRALLESLRATDARSHFERAVELDPGFALAHLGMANTAPSAAEFFAALDRATAAVDNVSEGEKLLIEALAAGVNGEPARQKELLDALVAAFPEDPRALTGLANYYFGRQEWSEAASRYRRVTELEPTFSQAYNQLGYALRFEGEYAGAEAAFQHYVALVPDEPNPYDSYAELLMKMGRFDESIARYREALERNPNFVASYVGIALDQTLLGNGDVARATLAELEAKSRNDGERRAACFQAAVTRLHESDADGALADLTRQYAIAEAAGDKAAMAGDLNLMGNVLLSAGRTDEALAKFEQGVETSDASNATDEVKNGAHRNHDFDLGRVELARGEADAAARDRRPLPRGDRSQRRRLRALAGPPSRGPCRRCAGRLDDRAYRARTGQPAGSPGAAGHRSGLGRGRPPRRSGDRLPPGRRVQRPRDQLRPRPAPGEGPPGRARGVTGQRP